MRESGLLRGGPALATTQGLANAGPAFGSVVPTRLGGGITVALAARPRR